MDPILRQVKCSERYPAKPDFYYTNKGILYFYLYNKTFCRYPNRKSKVFITPSYWFEAADCEDLNNMEVFSNLIIENQGLKLAIEQGHGGNCIIAPLEEVQKIAQERFEKASKYLSVSKNSRISSIQIDNALKISAGLINT